MKTPSAPNHLALRCKQGRLCAIQWLFHQKTTPSSSTTLSEFQGILAHEFGSEFQPDQPILRRLLKSYEENQEKIIELIQGHLPANWSFQRLDPVILSMICVAIAEAFTQKTPFKVILREYGDIALTFYSEKEISFIHKVINGILTSMGYAPPPSDVHTENTTS